MAQIKGVQVAKDGVITYEGAVYKRDTRDNAWDYAEVGDIVQQVRESYSYLPRGSYYLAYADEDGDIVIADLDGDACLIDDENDVFKRVKAESVPDDYVTIQYRKLPRGERAAKMGELVLVAEDYYGYKGGETYVITSAVTEDLVRADGSDYVMKPERYHVLERISDAAVTPIPMPEPPNPYADKAAKLQPGAYGKITQAGVKRGSFSPHGFGVGDIVKVERLCNGYTDRVHCVRVETAKGGVVNASEATSWAVHYDGIAPIEYSAPTDRNGNPVMPGDKVRITNAYSAGGKYNNGEIHTVASAFGKRFRLNSYINAVGVCADEDTPSTILSIEFERYVPEPPQNGDTVRVVQSMGGHPKGTIGVVTGADGTWSPSVKSGEHTYYAGVEIIARAKDRVDVCS